VLPNAWSPVDAQLTRELAREELKLSDHVFNVGWVGRVSHEKGADILVEALPLLNESFHATVIGDGTDRPTLERRAKELRIDDRISWCGEMGAAPKLFAAFDLFVNCSRTEGTPITLFEAMQASVPIVATAVGGVPDVLSAEEAILIPPEDPAALAAAIREVQTHPTDAARRALRARRRLEKDFATSPWLESYERIYRSIIRDGRNS
jgi:glycosyltransferase involved in cell wall biosynthesis